MVADSDVQCPLLILMWFPLSKVHQIKKNELFATRFRILLPGVRDPPPNPLRKSGVQKKEQKDNLLHTTVTIIYCYAITNLDTKTQDAPSSNCKFKLGKIYVLEKQVSGFFFFYNL